MGYISSFYSKDPIWVTEHIAFDLFEYESTRDENNKVNDAFKFLNPERCSEPYFPNKTLESIPDLRNMFWIPSNLNLTGSSYSKSYKDLNLKMYYKPNTNCALTYEEFLSSIEFLSFNMIIANEYFDPSNNEDPIKTVLNDQYRVKVSPDRVTRYEIFIQKNTYEIENGNLLPSKIAGEFYRVGTEK